MSQNLPYKGFCFSDDVNLNEPLMTDNCAEVCFSEKVDVH